MHPGPQPTIRILLVDDEPEVRQGWRMRLGLEPDLTVVGEADNADTALALARETRPDVILLDVKLPGWDGITITYHLRSVAPNSRIIIVTLYDDPRHRAWAKEAGAAAFVAKQESPEKLLSAIHAAVQGSYPGQDQPESSNRPNRWEKTMDEPSIFQEMSQAGYLLLDPPHPHSPGGTRLLVALREIPTELHFDPKLIQLSWRDPNRQVHRSKLTLTSDVRGVKQVCAGPVVLRDRFDKRVQFFVYGGTLEVSSFSELTIYSLHTPAPILEMTNGFESLAQQLAAESEAQLAKLHAKWGENDEGFMERLADIDPLRLYAATIASILAGYKQSSGLRQSFHPFYEMLLTETKWLSEVGPEESSGRLLDDLLA